MQKTPIFTTKELAFISYCDIIMSESCDLPLQIEHLEFDTLDNNIGWACCTSNLNSHKKIF